MLEIRKYTFDDGYGYGISDVEQDYWCWQGFTNSEKRISSGVTNLTDIDLEDPVISINQVPFDIRRYFVKICMLQKKRFP